MKVRQTGSLKKWFIITRSGDVVKVREFIMALSLDMVAYLYTRSTPLINFAPRELLVFYVHDHENTPGNNLNFY